MTDENVVNLAERQKKPEPRSRTVMVDGEHLTIEDEQGNTLYVYVTHYEFEGQTEELLIYAENMEQAERRIQAIMTRLDLIGQLTAVEQFMDD